ncbi:MAG TPA: acyl-CoA dehydrogenase family protein [Thermodesulfobacteriota bacterium]|nr:acyl-CoA dehydrogenase family protein [Deltaproteobacteria bacterium]HNR12634.1 acyl-CoA dehydrogenase family protein [Thermodesulfobacteriota bacterium]HNU71165.1 acyl-CoA dehydrogenase family protein [Thermodesulfobacteriota bacterium]HOC38417.1 acyl-CoA dehydrogenase family protein [Thermodesulfobacteriota bacterium]HQO77110.1 acyl-CoA dehydrogenase family protein [Thermodesulfobacteriota bacterium]
MDYFLTDEQKEIQALARTIAEEKVVPVRAELDEKEQFPREILDTLCETGLSGVFIDQKYGGFGGGVFELCLVIEQLSRACTAVAVSYACNGLGLYPIILFGTEEQKERYLPMVATQKKLAAFGLTEPNAGSDAGGIQTSARKDGNAYILNGTKQWITNGGEADIYVVIALTDKSRGPRGASAFILEKGMEGFSFGKKEKKMGIRASSTTTLIFEDCRVPKENLLGTEGKGFMIAMKNLDQSRPGIGAQGVGLAQGALEAAVQYARERHQFGKPIISFQAIQHILADMATQTEAARALIYSVARYMASNPRDFSKVSAMAKVFATDVAMNVSTQAVQVFGGYGYTREYPVEKMMRDAKILQIYEGTNQIQRNVIGLELNKEQVRRR